MLSSALAFYFFESTWTVDIYVSAVNKTEPGLLKQWEDIVEILTNVLAQGKGERGRDAEKDMLTGVFRMEK